ncbi:hypothetical protein BCT75_04270 [Vibrio lentus]|uniref:hypothetical protein n=1 Tax=Vibrio lentus TaxID=136468 RepID=UPI000C821549|nr:hypothetical protein [Vibrio lentus]PML45605.1 hypothetical protein BCT75_04270 [Vibrio lentus]
MLDNNNNQSGDFESAKAQADKFNSAYPIGSKVTYQKSQVEGKLLTNVKDVAKVYESYPNGQLECVIMADLKNVGLALISKIEPKQL